MMPPARRRKKSKTVTMRRYRTIDDDFPFVNAFCIAIRILECWKRVFPMFSSTSDLILCDSDMINMNELLLLLLLCDPHSCLLYVSEDVPFVVNVVLLHVV